MRIKIESDGTLAGCMVTNADTGEVIEGVSSLEWHLDTGMFKAVATIKLVGVAVSAIGVLSKED